MADLSVILGVLGIIRRLLFPSFPLRYDKHSSDCLPHPVHQKHETFHRDTVQHPSVPSEQHQWDTPTLWEACPLMIMTRGA